MAIFEIPKCPTGIQGLDEITFGGLPKGRPTLICGGPGCGKTLLAMEFLYRGVVEFNEPGVFMAFEEKEKDLSDNFASLGFGTNSLIKQKKLVVDYVYIERSEIEEIGDYDLEGLFVRLAAAIDSVGAKRVVLDTIEAIFSGFSNESILRAELRRLFRWLKDKGVTAIVTGERSGALLTKHGLEEYVADCVIFLDHRVSAEIATRRLKIIKYRGSRHGTNEVPFLIGERGLSVFPMTSLLLSSAVSAERISSGIKSLDAKLSDKGYYRRSSILVSGSSGCGKTSFGAQFVDSVCRSGQRALFFAFEESEGQLIRNMQNIGIDLKRWTDKGLLKIVANRASLCGLEMHLVMAHNAVKEFKPAAVVIDPITALIGAGMKDEVKSMLARLLDFLKNEGITVLVTDFNLPADKNDAAEVAISSLCDTWIILSIEKIGNRRQRMIEIIKSRGMKHGHDAMYFEITDKGLEIEGPPVVKVAVNGKNHRRFTNRFNGLGKGKYDYIKKNR